MEKNEPSEKRRRSVDNSLKLCEEEGLQLSTDFAIDPLRTKPPRRLSIQVPMCAKTKRRMDSRNAMVVNEAKTIMVRNNRVSALWLGITLLIICKRYKGTVNIRMLIMKLNITAAVILLRCVARHWRR